MSTIQQNILETFYQKLAISEGFSEEIVTEVRKIFETEKKLNAADLVKVFSDDSKDVLP